MRTRSIRPCNFHARCARHLASRPAVRTARVSRIEAAARPQLGRHAVRCLASPSEAPPQGLAKVAADAWSLCWCVNTPAVLSPRPTTRHEEPSPTMVPQACRASCVAPSASSLGRRLIQLVSEARSLVSKLQALHTQHVLTLPSVVAGRCCCCGWPTGSRVWATCP
jgi:hypothetical protein